MKVIYTENYFKICLEEAEIANKNNEIPIGAVVVLNNKIIGKGHNNRNISCDVTEHAEVIAIKEAAKTLGDWRLDNCDLYVTLEPCLMCKEIIKESRIKNVYYLVKKEEYKHSSNKTKFTNVDNDNFQQMINNYKEKLSTFFVTNCNR